MRRAARATASAAANAATKPRSAKRAREAAPPAPRKRAATTAGLTKPDPRPRPPAPPEPKRDAAGRLVFPDAPGFGPRLTPEQVIRAGSFGGIYFNRFGGKPGIIKYPGGGVPISPDDFPAAWFEGLPVDRYAGRRYRAEVNKYGVAAGQDQAYWEGKGWMVGPDKRGWFEWYCRYFMGRRCDDDARQLSRWKGVASDTGRWRVQLANRLAKAGLGADAAARVSPVICQTLLHWGDELVQADVDRAVKKLKKEGKL